MTNRTEFEWDEQELKDLFDSTKAIDPKLLDLADAIANKSVTSTEEDDDIFLSHEEIKAIFGEIEDEDIIF
jgi:hypothetical protein